MFSAPFQGFSFLFQGNLVPPQEATAAFLLQFTKGVNVGWKGGRGGMGGQH